jgi:hypothetical protein
LEHRILWVERRRSPAFMGYELFRARRNLQ